mmetsp:Transcript_45109/g.107250  ORF Transcript_45109/g.107250 Transcript_45109/m.107250 type:complete len:1005 (+) Transcript_45109:44-3058(+)
MGNAAVIWRKLPHEQPDLFKNALGITPGGATSSKTAPAPPPQLEPPPPPPKGGTGCAIGSWNGIAGITGVATSRLETEDLRARDAVHGLITRAALECGGDAFFYSCPAGAGRHGVHALDLPRTARSRFSLIFSSSISMSPGDSAPREHSEVLRQALEMDGANQKAAIREDGDVAAACVSTANLGCEGILLVERPPCMEMTGKEPLEVLRCVKLWSLVLGERLERLHWRQRATEGRKAVVAAEAALSKFVQNEFEETIEKAADIIQQKCLEERVKSDRAALWFLDPLTQEFVLNNSGHLDGIHVPLQGAMGTALTRSQVVYIQDVEDVPSRRYNKVLDERTGFKAKSVLCVPLTLGRVSSKQDDEALAVLQFKTSRGNSLSDNNFGHFDLAGAESLLDSKLGTAVWLRHCFFKLVAAERQIAHVEAVGAKLRSADGLQGLVHIVEGELTEAMHCQACTLWLVDEEHNEVWSPPSEKLPNGIRLRIGDGIVGQAVEMAQLTGNRAVQVVNDPAKCSLWKGDQDRSFVTRNIMTATVWAGTSSRQRPAAVLQALNKTRSSAGPGFGGPSFGESEIVFTDSDVMLLELLLPSISENLQRVLLDISWTKTFMDKHATSQKKDGDDEDAMEMVHEYYNADLPAMRSSQLSAMTSGRSWRSRPSMKDQVGLTPSSTTWKKCMSTLDLEEVKRAQIDIDSWHIDYAIIGASGVHEFQLLYEAIHRFDVHSHLVLPRMTLHHFFEAVKQSYRDVPFHNFAHALSTIHYAYKLAVSMKSQEQLSRTEVFALLVGALCHDLDHRGHNNTFEIVTRSELALRYNDIAPLENHHCAQAFQLALNSDAEYANIFSSFSSDQYSAARKGLIAGILSTDMQNHGHLVEVVQKLDPFEDGEHISGSSLVKLILHAADIAQPLMPQDIAVQWSRSITEEFIAQAEDEERLGIPGTVFMQGLRSPGAAARSQLAFIDFVVTPLMQPLFRLHPSLAEVKKCLETNRAAFEREANLAAQMQDRGV